MNTHVTSEQIASYQQDGFLVYPGLLDAAEVVELKTAVLDACNVMGERKLADGHLDPPKGYYARVFTQKVNLWRINATIKKFMLNSQLGQMLCQLAQEPAMRMWHDQTLIKEPFANPTSWHLDNPYWSFSSLNAISIWIALEPVTPHNGGMYFIPGSHKMARHETPSIGQDMGALFDVYPEMARIDPVTTAMKPGDCSFHNGLTAHGATANMTRGRRIAMTAGYMPDGSTFNGKKNVLPNDYFNSLKPGDPLKNDDWNPIVGRLQG
jgi:ectoine hydroxylase-related dioxygenase (phytanoyl-CoA dioxygenase family)